MHWLIATIEPHVTDVLFRVNAGEIDTLYAVQPDAAVVYVIGDEQYCPFWPYDYGHT